MELVNKYIEFENKIIQKVCSTMNYNTYNKVRNTIGLSSAGLLVSSFIYPEMFVILFPSTYVFTRTYNRLFDGRDYTKDLSVIKKMYQEFLNNYNSLNKTFDLNNPVEVYTMFNYMLYRGYLSQNKHFEFSEGQARDLINLAGADVMTGQGVCRHVSSMLTDIFQIQGTEAFKLGVFCGNYDVELEISETEKYNKEEVLNFIKIHWYNGEEQCNEMIEHVNYLLDNDRNVRLILKPTDDKVQMIEKLGNHAITYVFDGKNSYFLDATQARIYRPDTLNNGILYDEFGNVIIKTPATKGMNTSHDYYQLQKHILSNHPTISIEEEKTMIHNIFNICANNQDVFDKFYSENKDIYEEVTDKVLKIKKPKRIIK